MKRILAICTICTFLALSAFAQTSTQINPSRIGWGLDPGTNVQASINGALNAASFAGADASIKINACITAVIAAGGGTCDASMLGGDQVMSQQINVGSYVASQQFGAITTNLILPNSGNWSFNITDGVSCGIMQYDYSSIRGPGSAANGNAGLTLKGYNSASNLASMYCTEPNPWDGGNYVKAEGFNADPDPGVVQNGAIWIRQMFDESSWSNISAGPVTPMAYGSGGTCTSEPAIAFRAWQGVLVTAYIQSAGAGCGTGSGVTWTWSMIGAGAGAAISPTWTGGALTAVAITNGGTGYPPHSPYAIHVDDTCCGNTLSNMAGTIRFGIDEVATGVTTTSGSNVVSYTGISTDNLSTLVGAAVYTSDNIEPATGANGGFETFAGATITAVTATTITLSANAGNSTSGNILEIRPVGGLYGGNGGGGTTTTVNGLTANNPQFGVPNILVTGNSFGLTFLSAYMEQDGDTDNFTPYVYVGMRSQGTNFHGVSCMDSNSETTKPCILAASNSWDFDGMTTADGIVDKGYGVAVAPVAGAWHTIPTYSHASQPLTVSSFIPATVGWYRVFDTSRLPVTNHWSLPVMAGTMEIDQLNAEDSLWDFTDGIYGQPSSLSVRRALYQYSSWGAVTKVEVSKNGTYQYVDVYVSSPNSNPLNAVTITFSGAGLPSGAIVPVPVVGAVPPSDSYAAIIDLTTLSGTSPQATTSTHQASSYNSLLGYWLGGTQLNFPASLNMLGTTDTQSMTNKTVDGVAPATMAFLDATSSVQTQLNGKAPTLTAPTLSAPLTCNTTNVGNAYSCTISPSFTLAAGVRLQINFNAANTGSATLSINGGSAYTFYKNGGTATLASNDVQANHWISAYFDSSNHFQLEGQLGQVNATQINGTTLAGLSTGLLKNTTSTGVPTVAVAGTDYQAPLTNPVTGPGSGATAGHVANCNNTACTVLADAGATLASPGAITPTTVTASGLITGGNDTSRTTTTTMTNAWTTTGLVLPTVNINTIKVGQCRIYWQMSSTSYTATFGVAMNNAPTELWGASKVIYAAAGTMNFLNFTQTATSATAISTAATAGVAATTYEADIDFTIQTGGSNSVQVTLRG